jgi:S1-C subfamily serine protease
MKAFSLFLAFILAFGAAPAFAQVDPVALAKGTVHELSHGDAKQGFCSAVAIGPDVAITAAHCTSARSNGKVYLHQGDKRLEVKSWQLPDSRDLAIISVPGLTGPYAERAPAPLLESFAPVLVLGYPLGGELTDTYGIFVGWIKISGEGFVAKDLLVLTAPVKPGNSGGGVFILGDDGKPYLIGVLIAQLGDGRMSFAEDVLR